jgi:hypothetical protein
MAEMPIVYIFSPPLKSTYIMAINIEGKIGQPTVIRTSSFISEFIGKYGIFPLISLCAIVSINAQTDTEK